MTNEEITKEINDLMKNFTFDERGEIGDFMAYGQYRLALATVGLYYVKRYGDSLTPNIQKRLNACGKIVGLYINFDELPAFNLHIESLEKVYAQSDK